VLLELIPWERGHPGRFRSRRDACAPRKNHARISVQILNDLASWELRIGDLRVYYEVREAEQLVNVVAIGIKRRNRVFIGGAERQL
jgi:mRNA-degrading endonuclease RelE of RelBE toxin-antitoxin system